MAHKVHKQGLQHHALSHKTMHPFYISICYYCFSIFSSFTVLSAKFIESKSTANESMCTTQLQKLMFITMQSQKQRNERQGNRECPGLLLAPSSSWGKRYLPGDCCFQGSGTGPPSRVLKQPIGLLRTMHLRRSHACQWILM